MKSVHTLEVKFDCQIAPLEALPLVMRSASLTSLRVCEPIHLTRLYARARNSREENETTSSKRERTGVNGELEKTHQSALSFLTEQNLCRATSRSSREDELQCHNWEVWYGLNQWYRQTKFKNDHHSVVHQWLFSLGLGFCTTVLAIEARWRGRDGSDVQPPPLSPSTDSTGCCRKDPRKHLDRGRGSDSSSESAAGCTVAFKHNVHSNGT